MKIIDAVDEFVGVVAGKRTKNDDRSKYFHNDYINNLPTMSQTIRLIETSLCSFRNVLIRLLRPPTTTSSPASFGP